MGGKIGIFPQLVSALKLWKDINPIESSDDSKRKQPWASRHFQTRDHPIGPIQPGGCVYCQSETHKSIDCERLKTVDERKKVSCKESSVLIVRVASIAPQTARVLLHARNANGSTIRQFAIKQIIHFWLPLVMRTDRYAILLLM